APITGTVDLTNGHDINGHALLNSEVHNTKSGALIPQRGNVLVTTAVTTPTTNGLGGVLRAFRTYIPKSDSTQLSGWQFVSQLSASDPGGPIMTWTPAIMNPPSLDPPPDASYPKVAEDNKGRRSIVWVGTNWGIFEGIDARLGVEVWGFIPLNLLPKLRTIRDGQPMGN